MCAQLRLSLDGPAGLQSGLDGILSASKASPMLCDASEVMHLRQQCSAVACLAALAPEPAPLGPLLQPLSASIQSIYARPYMPHCTVQRVLTLTSTLLAASLTPATWSVSPIDAGQDGREGVMRPMFVVPVLVSLPGQLAPSCPQLLWNRRSAESCTAKGALHLPW